jgi:lactonase family protein with 7-bladed beta-propeller
MKFTKFGKALLMSALSAGIILGVSSCIESYAVGYLYVMGNVTAQSGGNGIITGFSIDHNTGKLTSINGLPIGSGGANPGRSVLIVGSRFLYVLNRGVSSNPAGSSECTTVYPCSNSNITQFAVGGNGSLTPQQTFYTQGINPFRLLADSTGTYLYVLDHDSPSANGAPSSSSNPNPNCALALGAGITNCGDITAFSINQTTGRLQLIVNAQVTAANGAALTYFPVPANPIDFLQVSGDFLILSGTPTTGDAVFPYAYSGSSGQLTISQNSSQPLGIAQGTAIVSAGGVIYVLDNEAPSSNPNGAVSQILPFSVGTGGALQAETGGSVPDDPTLSNPIYVILESKGKFLYLANQNGNSASAANPNGGIAGYVVNSPYQLTATDPTVFGTGSGPQCIVEDPSDQYVYTANFNDSTVTGRVVDPNSGVLTDLRVASSYALTGPPAWCLVDGRTN